MTGPYAAYWGEHLASEAISAADYSSTSATPRQFYLVAFNGTLASNGNGQGVVAVNTVAGAGQVKVMVNAPKAGDPAFLWDIGESKVVAGAAITIGQLVMSDNQGRVVPYVNNGVNCAIGECRLPTINGAGDIITCFFWPSAGFGEAESAIQDGISADQTSGQSNATPLVMGWNRVSTSAAEGYVVLPAAVPGGEVILVNDTASSVLVYGNGSDTIDGTAAATGKTATTDTVTTFICLTAGAWHAYLVARL